MTDLQVKGEVPKRAHEFDAGADLYAQEAFIIQPGDRVLVPTGTQLNLPVGLVGYVCPRSGMAHRDGVTVLNSPGVIDTGYTGEILVNLINLGSEPFNIKPGDRIAQLVVQPVNLNNFVEVPEFTTRWGDRGADGHGSSGE